MTRKLLAGTLALGLLTASCQAADELVESQSPIQFKKHRLDETFRSEGVAVGDFNNDGKLDIAANTVVYQAPDWTPMAIDGDAPQYPVKGYSRSFNNFAADVNGDGHTDLIVVNFPGDTTVWYQNPGTKEGAWAKHVLLRETNNESPQFRDLTGDGKPEFVFSTTGGVVAYATPGDDPTQLWDVHNISTAASVKMGKAPNVQRFYHGLGVGDVNADGRKDVILPDGWFEQPENKDAAEWIFHKAPLGPACADMYAGDFNGDGRPDVLSSSAHQYGIWWHEQKEDGWQRHEIDTRHSQTHAMCLADIDGDGDQDFLTGKRYYAHNGNDPGAEEPAVLYWYEYQKAEGGPKWTPHLIDRDSGMGTQFQVIDVNGDGLLDIVTSNKKGVHYFEQVRN
jgi:hypothetical protein